jgi:hypothetical protein
MLSIPVRCSAVILAKHPSIILGIMNSIILSSTPMIVPPVMVRPDRTAEPLLGGWCLTGLQVECPRAASLALLAWISQES